MEAGQGREEERREEEGEKESTLTSRLKVMVYFFCAFYVGAESMQPLIGH